MNHSNEAINETITHGKISKFAFQCVMEAVVNFIKMFEIFALNFNNTLPNTPLHTFILNESNIHKMSDW